MNFDTNGGMRKYSSGESITGGPSTNNEKKHLPNYLRASTSSCHDFCKYGRRSVEAEAKNSFMLTSGNKSSRREKPQGINNSVVEGRKNKLTIALKSSSAISKQQSTIKEGFALTSENEQLVKKISLKIHTSKKTSKTAGIRLSSPLAPSKKASEEEYIKCGEVMETVEKMKSSKSPPSLKHVGKGILISKQKQYKLGKQTTSAKNLRFRNSNNDTRSNREKTADAIHKFAQNVDMASAEKSLEDQNVVCDSLKELLPEYENRDMKSVQKELLEQEDSSGMDLSGQNLLEFEDADMNSSHENFLKPEESIFEPLEKEPANQEFIKSKNIVIYFQEEKLQKPNGTGLDTLELKYKHGNLLKQEHAEMNFHEHKLRKPEKFYLDFQDLHSDDDKSSHSAEEEIEEPMSIYYEATDLESEHEEKESNSNYGKCSDGGKRRTRRNAVVHPQVELSTPHKLKFRRGKIVEPQPESSGPRRLRFRRRLVDLRATVDQSERMNLRTSEEIPEGNDPNPTAGPSIILKHQVHEKKDTQGLFNSVIEETANKLVECRKSKVKALVGAFETVISLQDSKPASTA